MAQIDPISSTNDPRNTHNFTNPEYAIDDTSPPNATYASAISFASGGTTFRGLILDLGSVVDLYSITALVNYCGGGAQLSQIQTSDDGSTWTTQPYTVTNGTGEYRIHTFDSVATSVRYVSINWQQTGFAFRCWVQVFDIYGDGDAGSTPAPEEVPPVTFQINGVVFERLKHKRIRVVNNNHGTGFFVIDRHDEQATSANIFPGAVVDCIFPAIDPDPIFSFFIEEGDFKLLSSDEEGGEELSFGGPGILAYLRRATMDAVQYEGARQECFPEKDYWQWENSAGNRTEGDIIKRMVEEAQSASRPSDPIPLVSRTFNDDHDSNLVDWELEAFEGIWHTPIRANVYDETIRLAEAGLLSVDMDPGFVMNAYRDFGDDHTGTAFGTGVVRFAKGVNIVDEVSRSMSSRVFANHGIVKKPNGKYTRAALSGSWPYDSEVGLDARSNNNATAQRDAQGQMGLRADAQEAIIFAHLSPVYSWGQVVDEDAGVYLPGKPWTENGKYWVGDLVTLHTGTDEFDYDNETFRVYAIELYEDETGEMAPPIVELNAPYMASGSTDLSPTMPGTTAPSSGGGSSSGGGGTTGSTAHTHTPSVISPAQLTADTDDWYPSGLDGADVIRISTDASRTLSGINAADATKRIVLENVGAQDLVLEHDATSTAANRFYCPDDTDFTIAPDSAVEIVYDETSSRWRVLETPAGTGGGSSVDVEEGGTPVVTADTLNFGNGLDVSDAGGGQADIVVDPSEFKLDDLGAPDDNTDLNVSTSAHGLVPKVSGSDGAALVKSGTAAAWTAQYASIIVIIDGGGSVPSAPAVKADVSVPFACEVVRARLLADASGDAVVDVWVDTYANYPPTVGDSITASAKPTLSGVDKSSDTTLTGWTTAIAEGSTIRFNLDSISTITRLMVELRVRKT